MACFCNYCFSPHRFVGIGSAAKRVFAIDDDNYVYKMSAAKRLFILQRVDQTFMSTMHGSCKLKYRMGLDYKPRAYLESTPTHDILSNFLDFLSPALRISHQIDKNGVLHVNLILTSIDPRFQSSTASEDRFHKPTSDHALGMQQKSPTSRHQRGSMCSYNSTTTQR